MTATASYTGGTGGTNAISTTGNPANSWEGTGFAKTTVPGSATAPYYELAVDSSKYTNITVTLDTYASSSWVDNNVLYVWSSANGGAFAATTPATGALVKATWSNNQSFAAGTKGATTTTNFRINAMGASNTNASMFLDNIVITGCTVPKPPTMTKSFSPNPVAVGATSTLTFNVVNPNVGVALSGIAFTDILPTGLIVTTGSSAQCGGTLTLTAPNTLSFSGGTLATSATCTVAATVTATAAGPHTNVSGFVTSTTTGANNAGAAGIATATLTAVSPPSISKLFAPNPILSGGTSTLTFTITNPNQNNSLSGVAFSDTFPATMVVANPTGASTSSGCGAPTYTPVAAAGSISFSNGTIAAAGTCYVTVNVTASATGTNTSGNVSHIINAATVNGNTARDILLVKTPTPGIALVKEVGPTAAGPWTSFLATVPGAIIYYHYTVENYGDIALTSVSVSDTDPLVSTASCNRANLPVAVSGNDNHIFECTSSAFSASSGSWQYTATTTASAGATTVTDTSKARYATASLSVVKSATQNHFKVVGDVLNYSFVVTNSGSAPLPGPITVADNKASDESCPNVNTVGDFDNYFEPGETLTCTASYIVTAADVTAKLVTNTASASGGGFTSATVSKTIPLAPDLSVTKANNVGGTTSVGASFVWTLTVTNAATAGPATFADGQSLLQDDLPDSGATYSLPATATNSAGTTGTIACAIATNTLTCTASGGTVTIPAGESFSIAVTVAATAATTLVNPRVTGICQVDPTPTLAEIDETNNSCSNTVTSTLMPSLLVVKSAQTFSDPINGVGTGAKPIPSSFITYTIQVTNFGPGAVDNNSTVITDPIPANTELFVGDINGVNSGPILFTNGTTTSGLGYNFISLASITDNLAFSGNNGTDLYGKNNTAPDSNECDPTVTNIKIPLSGIFNGSNGTNHPSFNVKFRVRIK